VTFLTTLVVNTIVYRQKLGTTGDGYYDVIHAYDL